MKYGLKDEVVQRIIQVLRTFPEINEAMLYGSRAKGNFKPASDIDLTIKGNNLTHSQLNKIRLALDDLLLPYTFDVSLFEQIQNKDLIGHIERIGILFYSKILDITSVERNTNE